MSWKSNNGMFKYAIGIRNNLFSRRNGPGLLFHGVLSIAAHGAAAGLICWLVIKTHVSTVFSRPHTFTIVTIKPGADAPPEAAPRVRKAALPQQASAPLPQVTPATPNTAQAEAINEIPAVSAAAATTVPSTEGDASTTGDRAAIGQGGDPKGSDIRRLVKVEELDNTNFDPIFHPLPVYPPVAFKAHIEGYVDVDLVLDKTGKVISAEVIKVTGHPSFGESVKKTLPTWRFPPPRIKGQRVSVKYLYRVNFTLD